MNGKQATSSRWGIILSGGTGERMRPFIEHWLGAPTPKQYCAFAGGRTMLQQAVDRAARIIPQANLIVVAGPGHERFIGQALRPGFAGRVIHQPADAGTAGAVYMAAAHIFNQDPDATAVIFPADQHVEPEDRYARYLNVAAQLAECNSSRLILLGVKPNAPETDYGWIEPRRTAAMAGLHGQALPVEGFVEKPSRRVAARLLERDCLWNTMVVAVKVRMLWALGWRLPAVMRTMEELRRMLREGGGSVSPEVLAGVYAGLPKTDFSRDVLQRSTDWLSVLPLTDVRWSDWGRPERILASLGELGIRFGAVEAQPRFANSAA